MEVTRLRDAPLMFKVDTLDMVRGDPQKMILERFANHLLEMGPNHPCLSCGSPKVEREHSYATMQDIYSMRCNKRKHELCPDQRTIAPRWDDAIEAMTYGDMTKIMRDYSGSMTEQEFTARGRPVMKPRPSPDKPQTSSTDAW